ncbi:MAG: M20/M25/M40 family metallo-hydrolase, partial [Gemmataceae bacterium]|nr:M20/M25/M40 family metallo-hydrolase [Gemmataceae bacterium]
RALLERKGDHLPTTLVFFVQEEVGLIGSRGLDVSKLGEPKPTVGFNFDGYHADRFLTAVTGTQRFTIDIEGIAAHSGMNPEEGVSAALIAADALAELERTGWHGVIVKPEGEGRANVGILRGGTGSNVVMPALHILAEARSHDPRFRASIIAAWQDAFQRSATQRRNHEGKLGTFRFGRGPTYEAYALPDNAPVVCMAIAAAERIGLKPQLISDYGGNDANWLAGHGIPAITIGCGQRHVHMPTEEIDLGDFQRACELARALAV